METLELLAEFHDSNPGTVVLRAPSEVVIAFDSLYVNERAEDGSISIWSYDAECVFRDVSELTVAPIYDPNHLVWAARDYVSDAEFTGGDVGAGLLPVGRSVQIDMCKMLIAGSGTRVTVRAKTVTVVLGTRRAFVEKCDDE